EIDGADVPNRLNETPTTTTTTTVPPTTTTTTLLDTPETTTTTTEAPAPTEIVDIFFVSRGQLTAKPFTVLAPVSPNELIDLLEAGPGLDAGLLDNEILPNLIETTSVADGILTIELNTAQFDRIAVRDQREAIAQMVLTFLNNLRGVGTAVFTIDGVRQTVPIDEGQVSDEPVSRDDYTSMLVNADREVGVEEPVTTTDPVDDVSTSAP
ncbi:MAG: hypothetical protein ABJ382_12635, partial [Ilumatobacter sp.]